MGVEINLLTFFFEHIQIETQHTHIQHTLTEHTLQTVSRASESWWMQVRNSMQFGDVRIVNNTSLKPLKESWN